MSQNNDILLQTLALNYKINEKASLLYINQCEDYLKIVMRHLNEVLNRLNDQKKILHKLSSPLISDTALQYGLHSLKERTEEIVNFINNCEVNGKKTITYNNDSQIDHLVLIDEPIHDLDPRNLTFQPVSINLDDLDLFPLYKQLNHYLEEKTIKRYDDDTTSTGSTNTRSIEKYIKRIHNITECRNGRELIGEMLKRKMNDDNDENSSVDDISFDDSTTTDTNSSTASTKTIPYHSKLIQVWEHKLERTIEKISLLVDLTDSRIDILKMRKNFIIAETKDKIALNLKFGDVGN